MFFSSQFLFSYLPQSFAFIEWNFSNDGFFNNASSFSVHRTHTSLTKLYSFWCFFFHASLDKCITGFVSLVPPFFCCCFSFLCRQLLIADCNPLQLSFARAMHDFRVDWLKLEIGSVSKSYFQRKLYGTLQNVRCILNPYNTGVSVTLYVFVCKGLHHRDLTCRINFRTFWLNLLFVTSICSFACFSFEHTRSLIRQFFVHFFFSSFCTKYFLSRYVLFSLWTHWAIYIFCWVVASLHFYPALIYVVSLQQCTKVYTNTYTLFCFGFCQQKFLNNLYKAN